MFAILEEGAKQYLVKVGDVIKVEKLDWNVGTEMNFDKVLLVSDGAKAEYVKNSDEGTPQSIGTVKGVVLEHKKTDKVIIFKKKRRHNYRRKRGYRKDISVIKVTAIEI
ncbi:50S ribosomal protein L21 [Alphaproteobacteria bacterium]